MALANKQSPQPLLKNPYKPESLHWKAYDQCLSLEKFENWNMFAVHLQEDYSEAIMLEFNPRHTARVPGWAFIHAPGEDGRYALTREIIIVSRIQNAWLDSPIYMCMVLSAFYNPEGPTPSPTATQSPRLPFSQARENLGPLLDKSSMTVKDLRHLTLFRDNNCCVFSGFLDRRAALTMSKLDLSGQQIRGTKVAHIISQSLSEGVDRRADFVNAKFEWAKTAGGIIERFGGFSSHDVLSKGSLNSPANAFTAAADPHELFDDLDLWLIPTVDERGDTIPNTYDVQSIYNPVMIQEIKERITFRSAIVGNKTIPAPDSRIIALHAACAQVAHMSGAVEHLRETYREIDPISSMTEPSAAYELTRALKALQAVPETA